MRNSTCATLGLLLLTSCANVPPSDEELAAADFGPEPAADHQERIKAVMERVLKDPESARYRFDVPLRDWATSSEGYIYGWKVQFYVNARNSYGGYVGDQPYKAFFWRGYLWAIMRPLGKDLLGYVAWGVVAQPWSPSSP